MTIILSSFLRKDIILILVQYNNNNIEDDEEIYYDSNKGKFHVVCLWQGQAWTLPRPDDIWIVDFV